MIGPGNLDEIAVFVHVVQAGSFTGAARQRNVPKSTLSRAVSRLEETLHTRLLQRTSRKIALTEAGRAFYDRAAPHIAGLRDATEALDADDQPQGALRITAAPDAGEAFLGEVLVRFTARYPQVRVEVDLSARRQNLVEEGYDCALRAAMTIDDASLVARRLVTSEMQLFASPGYLAARGTPATLEDVPGHACVLFRPVDGRSTWTFTGSNGEEKSAEVTGRVAGSDFAFIHAALRAGAGIGYLPSFQATRSLADGSLQRVLPGWHRLSATLWLVYPASRHVPRKVLAFRDFLLESFGEPGATGRRRAGM
jgi:DNA-binding transcriptional LysR family regulator